MDINKLTEHIIPCAYRVHNTLGPAFLEKVYENALRIEDGLLLNFGPSVEVKRKVEQAILGA